MTSSILPSPTWRIHKSIGKNIPDFHHQFPLFWFDISKAINLEIIKFYMHILIWNVMKIGEKQRTMLAQTQYSVLSATLCVCVCDVRLPNFAPFYPIN